MAAIYDSHASFHWGSWKVNVFYGIKQIHILWMSIASAKIYSLVVSPTLSGLNESCPQNKSSMGFKTSETVQASFEIVKSLSHSRRII